MSFCAILNVAWSPYITSHSHESSIPNNNVRVANVTTRTWATHHNVPRTWCFPCPCAHTSCSKPVVLGCEGNTCQSSHLTLSHTQLPSPLQHLKVCVCHSPQSWGSSAGLVIASHYLPGESLQLISPIDGQGCNHSHILLHFEWGANLSLPSDRHRFYHWPPKQCECLPSCSIHGLSYICVVLSLYLYLPNFPSKCVCVCVCVCACACMRCSWSLHWHLVIVFNFN